jgi:hypothetical protein
MNDANDPTVQAHGTPIGSVREVFFERLVPGRECGDCVACCKILQIDQPDLQKAADVLCSHCSGQGCAIYTRRPSVCRTWYCLWRRIDALPDHLRPDKIGVVFSIDQHPSPRIAFEKIYIVARAIDNSTAFDTEPVKAALEMFATEGSLPVWVSFQGQKHLYYPAGPLADAILRPENTPWQSLAVEGLAWRKRYGLD